MRIRFCTCVIAFLCFVLGLVPWGMAQQANRDSVQKMTSDAISYLQASQQPNGAFSAELGPAVTAIVATGLVRNGRTEDDPLVSKAVQYVLSNRRSDGGIYAEGSKYRNYETSIAVMLLSELNKDGNYQNQLQAADRFLKEIQWDEGEGLESSDYGFGGAGYGSHKRPDLSNTTFLIEALRATGNDADSEAIQRALAFVSRCQNLESEHNTTPFPAKNPDGGFYYTAAAGGSSQAGETANGGLRSYASMTYAGLKSMIFAGVGPEDKRVKAALSWIQKHYALDSNPGMGTSGLFYYYHTFAKTLSALGEDQIKDEDGKVHHWKQDLIDELAKRQQADGSWLNEDSRWLEGNKDLSTAYALLALSYCR